MPTEGDRSPGSSCGCDSQSLSLHPSSTFPSLHPIYMGLVEGRDVVDEGRRKLSPGLEKGNSRKIQ